MPQKDAKSQALRVRRNQKGRPLLPDSDKHQGSRQDSTAEESLSVTTGGANRSGSDFNHRLGGATVGGILRELMDEVDRQSAHHSSQASYHNSQLEKLSDRRRHLEQLYQELQAQAGAGGDVESDDDEELEPKPS